MLTVEVTILALSALAQTMTIDEPKTPVYPDRVVEFKQGEGGGHGKDNFPDVVLGGPRGGGKLIPSQHVLSLGQNGHIILEFVDNEVIDGPGTDLLIFENPFLQAPGNDPDLGFFELAKVELSADGKNWKLVPFDQTTREGCAGHHPVFANTEKNDIPANDVKRAGGDPFDLKDVGLTVVRFVRITDLDNGQGSKGTAGFDLDGVAAVHSRPRKKETEP